MNQYRTNNNMNASGVKLPSGSAPAPKVHEYSIRMGKKNQKQHNVLKFNYNLNVDFDKWNSVKMERENNMNEIKGVQPVKQPKFGAGSEYNKEAKDEARYKIYGINAKQYNPNAQPWILDDGNKKFRGTREGGIGDNSSYYVFAHNEDGTITAYPLKEWHSFQPIQRFKPLSAEQAEEEFTKRSACVNKWSMKLKMQLNGEDAEEAEEIKPKKGSKFSDKMSALKISDMDEFMNTSDESSSDEENDENKQNKNDDSDNESKSKQKKAKGKAALVNKKKKERDLDDEAGEESDDGDQEGREREYIESSESESEPETETVKYQLKSLEEEKDTFSSDSDDSDDEKPEKDKSDEEKKEKFERDNKMVDILNDIALIPVAIKEIKENKSKMDIFNDAMNKTPGSGNKSDFSSDSDEEDVIQIKNNKKEEEKKDEKESKFKKGLNIKKESKSKKDSIDKKESKDEKSQSKALQTIVSKSSKSEASAVSAFQEPVVPDASNKRKAYSPSPPPEPAKKNKTEASATAPAAAPAQAQAPVPAPLSIYSSLNKDDNGLNEEAVRRYLLRKPMTTIQLITKFRKLRTVPKDNFVESMTSILKKIKPFKQTIQGKIYLSLIEM